MSKIIEIIEENNELRLVNDAKIICGNSNYKLKFILSEDWRKAIHKAVVFCVCGKKITQTFVGDECVVPIMSGGGVLFVSLVAGDEDMQLATTEVRIELVETFSNVDFVPFEPLRNDLASLLDAVNDIEKGNILAQNSKHAEFAENVSNPNLLINGDFKVNQRGGSTYTETGKYTVDRWKLVSGSVEVVENGIKLNGTIVQKLEHTPSMQVVASSNAGAISYSNGAVTLSTTTATLITYAKLEVGTTATPFSPRSYAEELAMCQRFYQVIKKESGATFLNIAFARSDIALRILNSLTQTLRCSPTIKNFNCIAFDISNNDTLIIPDNSLRITCLANNQCAINYGTTGLIKGKLYFIADSNGNAKIELDAEIY